MRYQVAQKMLALGGDYTVRNESGKEVFYFDGKVFSFGGKKVIVYDAHKRAVARITKKLFTFRPTYVVKRSGNISATIWKRGFTVRDAFVIDVPGINDYEVVGDYVGREYTIRRASRDDARVSKKFFGSTDSYGVDIQSGDELLLLCAVVVIDMVLYKKVKTN